MSENEYEDEAWSDEEADLHFSVEGLGQFHDIDGQNVFVKTDDCLSCLKDVQRFLRKNEDPNDREIELKIGTWETIQKRLLPLLLFYREDENISFTVLKVLVILTRPVNKDTKHMEIHLKFLQDYKEALNNRDVFIIVMSILMDAVHATEEASAPIDLPAGIDENEAASMRKDIRRERDEGLKQQRRSVELVFTLIRHLLEIPDPQPLDPGYTPARSDLQLSLLMTMQEEGILDILILFGEQLDIPAFREMNWLIFEIFYHICAAVDPVELLGMAAHLKIDLSKLLEKQLLISRAELPLITRHSRFGAQTNFKPFAASTGTAPPTRAARASHYRDKISEEKPNMFQDKTFVDIKSGGTRRGGRPPTIWKEFLADMARFFEQFVETVFGIVMASVMKEVMSESPTLHEYDKIRVINMVAWILEFQRNSHKREQRKQKSPDEAAATIIDVSSVQWAVNQNAAMLVTKHLRLHTKEAKSIRQGGGNVVIALRALLQQLKMVAVLGKSPERQIKEIGEAILDNLLYDEAGNLLIWVMKHYARTAHDPRLISYAVESLVALIKAMEAIDKKESTYAVRKKSKKSKKSKRVHKSGEQPDISGQSSEGEQAAEAVGTQQYGIQQILASVAHGECVKVLVNLIGSYSENSKSLNACIAFLIYRVVMDAPHNVAYFFQLSFFVVFHRFLTDSRVRVSQEDFQDLIGIVLYIVKKFFACAAVNKLAFTELVFPKPKSGRSSSLLGMDLELKGILDNYTDPEVRDMLDRLNEGQDYEELKKTMKENSESRKAWTEDEDRELLGLWEDFKNSKNRLNFIADTVDRPIAQVRKRLIDLGLMNKDAPREDVADDGDESEGSVEGGQSTPSARSSSSSEPEESNRRNLRDVIMGNSKKVDPIVEELAKLLKVHVELTEHERSLLGESVCDKYSL